MHAFAAKTNESRSPRTQSAVLYEGKWVVGKCRFQRATCSDDSHFSSWRGGRWMTRVEPSNGISVAPISTLFILEHSDVRGRTFRIANATAHQGDREPDAATRCENMPNRLVSLGNLSGADF